MKKVYRKYPNRRIYDTDQKRYVNLDDIKAAILKMHSVEVKDSKSGEDVTNTVLLQIIGKQESESATKTVTAQTLMNLIQIYENPLSHAMAPYLENFLKMLQGMPDITPSENNAFFNPFIPQGDATKTQDFWGQWMKQFQR